MTPTPETPTVETTYLTSRPNLRSAVRVFVYAFLGTFVPALLGFLSDVLDWTNQDGAVFPSVDVLGKALIAAVVGAVSGAIAFGYNRLPAVTSARYE